MSVNADESTTESTFVITVKVMAQLLHKIFSAKIMMLSLDERSNNINKVGLALSGAERGAGRGLKEEQEGSWGGGSS